MGQEECLPTSISIGSELDDGVGDADLTEEDGDEESGAGGVGRGRQEQGGENTAKNSARPGTAGQAFVPNV